MDLTANLAFYAIGMLAHQVLVSLRVLDCQRRRRVGV